jgi:hypothetical protein
MRHRTLLLYQVSFPTPSFLFRTPPFSLQPDPRSEGKLTQRQESRPPPFQATDRSPRRGAPHRLATKGTSHASDPRGAIPACTIAGLASSEPATTTHCYKAGARHEGSQVFGPQRLSDLLYPNEVIRSLLGSVEHVPRGEPKWNNAKRLQRLASRPSSNPIMSPCR